MVPGIYLVSSLHPAQPCTVYSYCSGPTENSILSWRFPNYLQELSNYPLRVWKLQVLPQASGSLSQRKAMEKSGFSLFSMGQAIYSQRHFG
jgi:hypothetical protein